MAQIATHYYKIPCVFNIFLLLGHTVIKFPEKIILLSGLKAAQWYSTQAFKTIGTLAFLAKWLPDEILSTYASLK